MSDTSKTQAHRGMATWGERLVPLDDFREAARGFGRLLRPEERGLAVSAFVAADADPTPVEGPYERVAVFGGIYSNTHALEALLEDVEQRGAEAVYCLGDFGGFGPNPEKVWPLLEASGVRSIQGNYEESLASGRTDCNCGYADPRDNRFADLSYRYTEQRCSMDFKAYMGGLPKRRRIRVGTSELLLVHGSPRRINEFLFESTSPVPFLEALCAEGRADGFLCSHTGLPWHRALPSGRDVVNVGVIGRPANDGRTDVWYTLLSAAGERLAVEVVPLAYDHLALADEMRLEQLPEEFVETVLTGWWRR
jgi:Calcineurin-like phosphoesterase superfamily domain